MSTYPDDGPPRPSRRRYDDDDYDRRPPNATRLSGRPKRADPYGASDEDDYVPPRREGSDRSRRQPKGEDRAPTGKHAPEPDLPHPPIGEDRDGDPRKPGVDGRARRGASADDDASAATSRRKPAAGGRDDADFPDRPQRRPRRDYDDERPAGRPKPRDRYDDDEPVRRRPPPGDRDAYDEPRLRRGDSAKDGGRGGDPRRKPRRAPSPDDDSDREHDRARRRRDDRPRYDDDYDRPRRRPDGYESDRPHRRPRDDYDRGYHTDRHDKRDPPRRDDRRRDDYDDRRHGGSSSKPKNDFFAKGQENWKKYEPIAKPLLQQLANTYLKGR